MTSLPWVRQAGRVLALVGREVGWWVGGTGRLWWRYKLRTSLHGAATAVAWWQDQLVLIAALVIPVVALATWARGWPASYRGRLADPLARYRFARWLRREWPLLMESVGLARRVPATGHLRRGDRRRDGTEVEDGPVVESPSLDRVRWTRGQLMAWPRLLTGQTVDDVELAADRLRVAVGARRCRILPNPEVTGCSIVWSFSDPLAAPFDATVPAEDAPLGPVGWVPLGWTEDGQVWRLSITMSTLVAGSSDSGKASVTWGLLFALGPQNRAGVVQLHGIDLKGGMELSMGRPLFTRYAQTVDHAVAMLEDDARNLQARAERLAGRTRQHVQSVDEPSVVIVIDELAALIAYTTDRDLTRRAEAALSIILSQGRAVGYRVFAFLQDPRKETVKMRHLLTQVIGLRLRDREEVTMVFGDGALRHGALCHKIPHTTRGVGYVLGEDNHPIRVRAGFVSDDMIKTAAARFPAPRQIPIIIPAEPETPARRPSTRARAAARTSVGGEP
ncbi:FtsK/SpoIIIE domain-containing protein [Microlunatus ginsengisoli]|uniref:FtsK/SpoIIIE domain-containing protein n=1 Tax=Microlunatus ginsengisoli TaxID=363863 RepID=A0ABP7AFD1_9ACTN